MKYDKMEISARLKASRECLDITVDDMAALLKCTAEEYLAYESGENEISVSALNRCAEAMGIDLVELLTGVSPNLQKYSLVRKGDGLPIERRVGLSYNHIAYMFKNKKVDPLIVIAPEETDKTKPIHFSVHDGQEMDYILRGKLKVIIGNTTEILEEGDCIYFDSSTPHGVVAVDGECEFITVLI